MTKTSIFTNNWFGQKVIPVLLIIFCGLGIAYLQEKTIVTPQENLTESQLKKTEEDQKVFLDFVNRIPSLGFGNLVADWVYLNFVQYFGDTAARNQVGYGFSPEFFRTIVDRDPRFVSAYSLLDPATTLFAGQASSSVEIMSQGLKSLTPQVKNAYLIWSYKGIDELLFMGKGEKAQTSYANAAKWALEQGDEESILLGQRFSEMAEFLKNNKDSKQAMVGSWLMVLSNAKDKKTVEITLRKIRDLGGKITIKENRVMVEFPEKK